MCINMIARRNAKVYRLSRLSSLCTESTYAARVQETPASRLCRLEHPGDYVLRITAVAIHLTDTAGNIVNNLTWPYK